MANVLAAHLVFISELDLEKEIFANKSQQPVQISISPLNNVKDVILVTNLTFLENVLKKRLKILTLVAVNLEMEDVLHAHLAFISVIMENVLQFLHNVPILMSHKDSVNDVILDIS